MDEVSSRHVGVGALRTDNVIDVSQVDAKAVTEKSLRNCEGARLAWRAARAEQSLIGV